MSLYSKFQRLNFERKHRTGVKGRVLTSATVIRRAIDNLVDPRVIRAEIGFHELYEVKRMR
jgi:hypothetical protein